MSNFTNCYTCHKSGDVTLYDGSGESNSKSLAKITDTDLDGKTECVPAGFQALRDSLLPGKDAIACAENFRASRGMPESLQWITFGAVVLFAIVLGLTLTRVVASR